MSQFGILAVCTFMFSRHSPDARGFGARIVPLTGLGNGKSYSVRTKGRSPQLIVPERVKPADLARSRHTFAVALSSWHRWCPQPGDQRQDLDEHLARHDDFRPFGR